MGNYGRVSERRRGKDRRVRQVSSPGRLNRKDRRGEGGPWKTKRKSVDPKCPKCGAIDVRRIRRQGWRHLLRLIGTRVFLCKDCGYLFYSRKLGVAREGRSKQGSTALRR